MRNARKIMGLVMVNHLLEQFIPLQFRISAHFAVINYSNAYYKDFYRLSNINLTINLYRIARLYRDSSFRDVWSERTTCPLPISHPYHFDLNLNIFIITNSVGVA